MKYPDAVRRAGHADGKALFDAMLSGRSGITFTLDDSRGRASPASDPRASARSAGAPSAAAYAARR